MPRPPWTAVVPPLALVLLVATWGTKPPALVLVVVGLFLAASVLAAVHHAEVVAHRVGEPFGSLVLAVAVTVIEVGLIVTQMVLLAISVVVGGLTVLPGRAALQESGLAVNP